LVDLQEPGNPLVLFSLDERAFQQADVLANRTKSVYADMHMAIASESLRLATRERALNELDDIESLVQTHRARLLRFVTFSLGDEDLAASIVQDCFVKAWTNRHNFRGDCSVQTWLHSIALNLVRDYQRTQKFRFWKQVRKTATDVTEVAGILPSAVSSPEHQLLARERAREVAEILKDLSPNQRTAFVLRFQEELDLREIAQVMGLPINTVKTHLHRAVRSVRARMGGQR
jgi:RNA polymerase sigma-70 factor, ECF subfamily